MEWINISEEDDERFFCIKPGNEIVILEKKIDRDDFRKMQKISVGKRDWLRMIFRKCKKYP